MNHAIQNSHRWLNRLQTVLLIAALLGICALAGSLLFGDDGIWMALAAAGFGLLITPGTAWRLTLSFYRARPIYPQEAPALWQMLETLAERAELPSVPTPYFFPSPVINAFAVGSHEQSAIALSDSLLQRLSTRELAGVLAHEISHIANNDLRVMSLADAVSRITAIFASLGQLFLLLSIPAMLFTGVTFEFNWPAVMLLLFSPHLALLAQLGLSRTREYDADLNAAMLTGDPLGLAQALAHIEQASKGWLAVLFPGWGNPEPSWLRTHPPTEERIRRLQALVPAAPSHWLNYAPLLGYSVTPIRRAPRWRIGGLWR
ncbi:zinc metalloprotease HtpX [Methylomonas sp. SURF-1]|uniref:Zinc metalloprotease HtpX n=1 Tax=Methylomonas aurea TaxID=2952224 RepID=A0ABT1UHP8_9GAMM|nr:zinc metalloprotease HtpX [Methylomonas sp. SURF-1]MCQ8180951.1 zinc metalloprotease HtpX [Methylomonas sp. SURF-1]